PAPRGGARPNPPAAPLKRPGSLRPRVGHVFEATVGSLTLGGEAVVKCGDYVVFASGVIPGERGRFEVASVGQRYGRVKLLELLSTAPVRVKPRCAHFNECGGCTWQHIDYPAQLEIKQTLLQHALDHALGPDGVEVEPILGMDEPWGTRNKVHFLITEVRGKPALAHFAPHSRDVVAVRECPVHHELGNAVAKTLVELLHTNKVSVFHEADPEARRPARGAARHMVGRVAGAGDTTTTQAQATVVVAQARVPGGATLGEALVTAQPAVAGVFMNVNDEEGAVVFGRSTRKLHGHKRLIETVGGIEYLVSPQSFFQTNAAAAARLVDVVLAAVPSPPAEPVLDLYSGGGLFSLALARRGHAVTAVEENPYAVEDGVESARRNNIRGVWFEAGRTEAVLPRLIHEKQFATVVLDPPREGTPPETMRLVVEAVQPRTIVDVSCDPAALVRDLKYLTQNGYRLLRVQPLDMFPHTAHVESVAVLRRVERPTEPAPRRSEARPRRPAPPNRRGPRDD
ncbi:MAG: 23S rRNA (uracil(1939)-C(5))-methyltransferase RlmD, partial [Planctomycetia bacterium]